MKRSQVAVFFVKDLMTNPILRDPDPSKLNVAGTTVAKLATNRSWIRVNDVKRCYQFTKPRNISTVNVMRLS